MRTIEIAVDARGAATVAARGFAGPSCREASRPYREALGAEAAERLTDAYRELPQPLDPIRRSG